MINIIAGIVGVAIVVGTVATVLDKRINALQSDVNMIIDKIEDIDRELRGQTYAIEFWNGVCYGGFEKNGKPAMVDYDEAMIMTRREAERIKTLVGSGAIVNRSKTILKNLEDK